MFICFEKSETPNKLYNVMNMKDATISDDFIVGENGGPAFTIDITGGDIIIFRKKEDRDDAVEKIKSIKVTILKI